LARLRPTDRIGEILNNRKIINIVKVNGRNKYVWECCVCGSASKGEYANLKKEKKNHCGCLESPYSGHKNPSYKHGKRRSSEYVSWVEMKKRLLYKNHKSYDHYVNVLKLDADPRWLNSFEAFYADMGDKPDPTFTLERKERYKGYWADNCCWATKGEQAQNKTTTFWCKYKENTYCLKELCRFLNLKYHTVYMRIRRGHKDPFFGTKDVEVIGVTS